MAGTSAPMSRRSKVMRTLRGIPLALTCGLLAAVGAPAPAEHGRVAALGRLLPDGEVIDVASPVAE